MTDIACQEADPAWISIRQGCQAQQILAKELHQKAGAPEGLRGLSEVPKFQAVIENYQIVVLSAEYSNAIIYEGPPQEKQIYLCLHESYFDIITSASGFRIPGKSYWCL